MEKVNKNLKGNLNFYTFNLIKIKRIKILIYINNFKNKYIDKKVRQLYRILNEKIWYNL